MLLKMKISAKVNSKMSPKKRFESVRFGKNVIIGTNVYIGLNCSLGNNVTLNDNVQLGDNCILRSNVVTGESNFTELLNHEEPKTTIIGDIQL